MIKAVGLFLLLLLKIVGWALLILLLVLLAVCLLVLFVPVRYDVLVHSERINPIANLRLRLKVNWLLHFIRVAVAYGPGGLSWQIRVAGLDIPKLLARRAEKKKAKRRQTKTTSDNRRKEEAKTPPDRFDMSLSDPELEPESKPELKEEKPETLETQVMEKTESASIPPDSESENKMAVDPLLSERTAKKADREKVRKTKKQKTKKQKIKKQKAKSETAQQESSDAPKSGIFAKVRTWIRRLHKEYTDEVNRHAVGHLWTEILKLLRSYRPRKLKADVSFSLADPALTGAVTGLISLIPVIYRYPCTIEPDFTAEKPYVEGEIAACGKVTVFVFVCGAIRLLRDKKFMQVVRRLLKRGGT